VYTPYAPPAAPPQNHYGPTPFFRPLGGLTTAAIVAIVFTVPAHLAANVVLMSIEPQADETSLVAAFTLLGIAAATIGINIVAIVLFLTWFHRAATNLRAFGQQGLEYTPGWCIGWWFVPFANLVKPFHAMKEVWRASDPDAVGANDFWAWRTSPLASTMGLWWGAWIVSGILDRVSGKIADSSAAGSLGIVSALISGLAALFLIPIMRQLAARQEASWAKLEARHAVAAQYHGYRAA